MNLNLSFESPNFLTYGRAALQLQVLQDSNLSALIGDTINLKRDTVRLLRTALRKKETDANALFNAAQALCMLAEELDDEVEDERIEAIALLHEAVELFSSCLDKQELEIREHHEIAKSNDSSDMGDATKMSDHTIGERSEPTSQFAKIIVPITPKDLIDTCLAALEALEQLVLLYASQRNSPIQKPRVIADSLLENKIPHHLLLERSRLQEASGGDHAHEIQSIEDEVFSAIASWKSSLAIAEYRTNAIDVRSMYDRVSGIYTDIAEVDINKFDNKTTIPLLISLGENLLSVARVLVQETVGSDHQNFDERSMVIIECLDRSQLIIRTAAKYSPDKKARLQITYGDCCLQKFLIAQLQDIPHAVQLHPINQVTDARTWYSEARRQSSQLSVNRESDGSISVGGNNDQKRTVVEATVKEALALSLEKVISETEPSDAGELRVEVRKIDQDRLREVLADMIEDKIIFGGVEKYLELLSSNFFEFGK